MSYEDSIVNDIPMKCSDEELAEMALKHYQGIAKAVMHWNSTIENSIKEYPRLKADNERLRELVGEMVQINLNKSLSAAEAMIITYAQAELETDHD